MLRRLGWVTVVVSVVFAVADTAITAQYRPLLAAKTLSEHAYPAVTIAAVASTVMGALIVSRYDRHPIGWLLCAGGVVTSFSLANESYSLWVSDNGGPGTLYAAHLTGWLSALAGAPFTLMTLTATFLLAPTGHLPSRRWRFALWLAIAGSVLFVLAVLSVSPQDFRVNGDQDFGLLVTLLSGAGIIATTSALIASVVSLIRRLRRAQGVVHQQLRWVACSAVALAGGMGFLVAAQLIDPSSDSTYSGIPLYLAYLAFPVCTAVAVLRYRLFDLDLIINRALLLTIATALVAVGYVLVVVAVSSAVGSGTGGFWPSLLATAVVAMGFQPVRRRVVRLADRLAYGASATPYEALADFSRRLGESPDPSRLLPAVADAAGTAVHARSATVRLPVPGAPDLVGAWPATAPAAPAGTSHEVQVVDRGEHLGTISVEMPPGRGLRDHDLRLLHDLADQAAIAFRNARLSAELAHQVELLRRQTLELVESRRRLITAGDAERRRLERAISREVVPHLEALPARLEQLAASADGAVVPGTVRPLVAGSTAALEALREITRGVFPAQLSRSGLEAALASLLARTGPGSLVVEGERGRRLDDRAEAAAYFCVAEMVRELGPPVTVVLDSSEDELRLTVRGEADSDVHLTYLRDRIEAVGGSVTARRGDGSVVLDLRVPVRIAAEVTA